MPKFLKTNLIRGEKLQQYRLDSLCPDSLSHLHMDPTNDYM